MSLFVASRHFKGRPRVAVMCTECNDKSMTISWGSEVETAGVTVGRTNLQELNLNLNTDNRDVHYELLKAGVEGAHCMIATLTQHRNPRQARCCLAVAPRAIPEAYATLPRACTAGAAGR